MDSDIQILLNYHFQKKHRAALKNPKILTMPKCKNIPGGSLIIAGQENESVPLIQASQGEFIRERSSETCAAIFRPS